MISLSPDVKGDNDMSTRGDVLINPKNGAREQTWTGFSWPCLFFGVFWFLYKHLYGWAIISFLAAVFTYGIAWLFFPFFANAVHRASLLRSGYVSEAQAGDFIPTPETHVRCPDCRELIRKDAKVCKHCGCRLIPQT